MSNLWLQLLFDEFFNQGDLERESEIQVSFLCDRQGTSIYRTQPGFIKFCPLPLCQIIVTSLPHLSVLKTTMEQRVLFYDVSEEPEDERKVYSKRKYQGLLTESAFPLE